MSALHIAVDINDSHVVLCFLASTIPNINIKNKVGRTALHLSAKSGNQDYIKILLDHGCDRDIKDKFGKKAVDIAKANNHDECVQILLHYVAQKRRNCQDINSNFKQQNGENISLRSVRRKEQNDADDNASKDLAGCGASHVLVESTICRINIQNADSPVEKAQLDLNIRDLLTSDVDSTLDSNENKRYLSIATNCTHFNKTDNLAEEETPEQLKEELVNVSAGFNSAENSVHSATPSSEYYKIEEEKREDTKNGWKKDNNIWNLKENCPSCEQVHQSGNYNKDVLQSMPELLPNNLCKPYLSSCQSTVFKPFLSCRGKDFKNGHHSNGFDHHSRELAHFTKHTKDMFILISIICGLAKCEDDLSFNWKTKGIKEYNDIERELQTCFTSVPWPVLYKEDQLSCCKLQNTRLKDFSFDADLQKDKTDILSKLLQGLKKTLNASSGFHDTSGYYDISGYHGISGYCSTPGFHGNSSYHKTSQNNEHTSDGLELHKSTSKDPVELFLEAARVITVSPEEGHKMLDNFCNNLYATSCESLVFNIFMQTGLLNNSLSPPHLISESTDGVLLAFEYVLQHKEAASYVLASSILEVLLFQQNGVELTAPLVKTRPGFVELVIRTASEETIWDEDKIAEVFLILCVVLSEDLSLLYRYIDVLLDPAFKRMNNMKLSSCILVRMGLLKSEFEVSICPRLKGPLLALTHVFGQHYFPASLASLFVSFLARPSPRFCKVTIPRENALEAAMLRELLQHSISLGKGLKRICDVLAHGDFWEIACRCSNALFEYSFSAGSSFTAVEHSSSILIYFGLIKSEFPVEVIKNTEHGLKVLLHAANHGDIPQSIAPVLAIFLTKGLDKTSPYKDDVALLVKLLTE